MGSRTIAEAIKDTEEALNRWRIVAEKYPDAIEDRLPDGRQVWTSESALQHATDISLVTTKEGALFACPYVLIEGGGHVFATEWKWIHAGHLVSSLKDKSPETYRALIEHAKKSV